REWRSGACHECGWISRDHRLRGQRVAVRIIPRQLGSSGSGVRGWYTISSRRRAEHTLGARVKYLLLILFQSRWYWRLPHVPTSAAGYIQLAAHAYKSE